MREQQRGATRITSGRRLLRLEPLEARQLLAVDVPQVVELRPTTTGFDLQLSFALDPAALNLYDGLDPALDPADLTLVGDVAGPVFGSLFWEATTQTLSFIKTGEPLLADRYRLTIPSRADGLVDVSGTLLDGDADGTPGEDFVAEWVMRESTARVLSLSDFARAPGQYDRLAADGQLTVRLDNAAGVKQLAFRLDYDPILFDVTSALTDLMLPAGWRIDSVNLATPGVSLVSLSGSTPLPAGPRDLLTMRAEVRQNAPADSMGRLVVSAVEINHGEIPARGDVAIGLTSLFGDVTGDGTWSAFDASLIARVAVGLDDGFDAYDWIDPRLVGDTSGSQGISGLDASFVARRAVGLPQAEIPTVTNGSLWFVSLTGDDDGEGTASDPWRHPQTALNRARPGDTIVLAAGRYDASLQTSVAGTAERPITVRAAESGNVTLTHSSGRMLQLLHPHYLVAGIHFDGQFGTRDAIQVSVDADGGVLRDIEVFNGRADGIDLGENNTTSLPSDFLEGFRIENAVVHHFLNFDNGQRLDAHAIVAGGVRDFIIRSTEAFLVSGDTFQLQDGGWDHVQVTGSRFWNGPLDVAAGGFPAGVHPGENAIDTKQDERLGLRGRLEVRNSDFFGWTSDFITNAAALNLKESVDAVVTGNRLFNNEIALRLRGRDNESFPDAGAHVTVKNNLLFGNLVAIRHEDGINQLHIVNNTFGVGNQATLVRAPRSVPAGRGFQVLNNLFLAEELPEEAVDESNLLVDSSSFVRAVEHDYRLVIGSAAINAGTVHPEVLFDFVGTPRPVGAQADAGAWEFVPDEFFTALGQ